MRAIFSILAIFVLAGCDTLHGVKMSVEPAFEEHDWECASEIMKSQGYFMEIRETGQLAVLSKDEYLFSAYPYKDGNMELYSYTLHKSPSCSHAENAYRAMKALIEALEEDCGYTTKNYSVVFECSSNNHVN